MENETIQILEAIKAIADEKNKAKVQEIIDKTKEIITRDKAIHQYIDEDFKS